MTHINPLFILEENYEDNKILESCKKLDFEYEILPRNADIYHKSHQPQAHVLFGGVDFVQRLNRWNNPGGYLNLEALKCSNYYTKKNLKYLINDNPRWLPLHLITDNITDLLRDSSHDAIFIRPDTPRKVFGGFVIDSANLDTELLWLRKFNPQLLCLVNNTQLILEEYRFFCIENKIITGSKYKEADEIKFDSLIPQDIFNYTQDAINNMDLPDIMYVVDVARILGGIRVVEFNSYCTSGVYSCDVDAIVKTIADYAVKDWVENYG